MRKLKLINVHKMKEKKNVGSIYIYTRSLGLRDGRKEGHESGSAEELGDENGGV